MISNSRASAGEVRSLDGVLLVSLDGDVVSGDLEVEVGLHELLLGEVRELVDAHSVGVRDRAFVMSLNLFESFQEDSESVPFLVLRGVSLVVLKFPTLEEVNQLVVLRLRVGHVEGCSEKEQHT